MNREQRLPMLLLVLVSIMNEEKAIVPSHKGIDIKYPHYPSHLKTPQLVQPSAALTHTPS